MCSLLKAAAAALLTASLASALVIPETPPPLSPKHDVVNLFPPSSQLQQSPSDALVNFIVPCNNCYTTTNGKSQQDQIFEFRVLPADRPCGTNDLWLNNQPLFSRWNGINAQGVQLIEAATASQEDSKDLFVSWNITCLFDALPDDGAHSQNDDVAQLLKLKIHGLAPEKDDLGFTVSYKQLGPPEILRLSLEVEHLAGAKGNVESWRNPSALPGFTSVDDPIKEDATTTSNGALPGTEPLEIEGPTSGDASRCRGLQCTLKWTLNKAGNAMRKMCHSFESGTPSQFHSMSSPASHSVVHDEFDADKFSSDHIASTHRNTSRNDPSTSLLTSLPSSPSYSSAPTDVPPAKSHRTDQALRAVKITSLLIILVSVSAILFARLMHPRRRADRAARREERRNKRLYKCAARRQRWRNWVGSFRRVGPSSTAGSWNEKQAAVASHEGTGEIGAMHTGIAELRDAHIIVSDLIRAEEEGRDLHISELDGRERRRARRRGDSLPGYESDESGPPAYDDKIFVIDGVAFVDGFQYMPDGIENTPDSSVVETSPRISMEIGRSESGKD